MIILAIETSCDDTCVAVIEAPGFNILSNIISSQIKIHKKWGGVYPALAKREHQKNLPIVLKKALKAAKNPKLDLIAVTIGPGLEPCLWTGINFAKKLARDWKLPIIPVNHIEAHIFANFVGKTQNSKLSPAQILRSKICGGQETQNFPAVCLVVSGGHTQLILMNPVRGQGNLVKAQRKQTSNGVKDFGKYRILGETRDDAAGECFDKVARILGLGYPGGPSVAKMATKFKIQNSKFKINLPRPMINQKNYDFSFSGLKTAVLYKVRSMKSEETKKKEFVQEISKEAQQAIIDVLIKKTIKAAKDYKAKIIILAGGVAANKELRRQFQQKIKKEKLCFKFQVPSFKLCTDNAVMTAIAGYYGWFRDKTKPTEKIKASANLTIN